MSEDYPDEVLEAEVALIGYALWEPLAAIPVEPHHIYDPLHRAILALLHEARLDGRVLSPLDVADATADHPDWMGLDPLKMLLEMVDRRSEDVQADAVRVVVGFRQRGANVSRVVMQ